MHLVRTLNGRQTIQTERADSYGVPQGYSLLFGGSREPAFSIHRFAQGDCQTSIWNRSAMPGCAEVWLNVAGSSRIEWPGSSAMLDPGSYWLFHSGEQCSSAHLQPSARRLILLVRLAGNFLHDCLPAESGNLHPVATSILDGDPVLATAGLVRPFTSSVQELAATLSTPPVVAAARSLWYRAKVLELISGLFFETSASELFCSRQKRLTAERVARVKRILRERLTEPPNLQAIAREVGCSPFYLSRTFSSETGMTISQYLRDVRIERAAKLLRTGACNVTEAAFEVGYNSPSHFSQAFCIKMGVCPALYSRAGRQTGDA